MAEPVVSFLVESIGKLLIDEGNFLAGVSDEAEKLHSELKMMWAMLKDADEKQNEAAILKEWISQCKDLAYDAEDVLETHAFKVSSRGSLAVVQRYACILNEVYVRHTVGSEIQSLNSKISNLRRLFHEYGIRAVAEREASRSSLLQQQMRITYSHGADDEDFVGFGPDVEKLVEVLVKEDDSFNQYGVVSISGMGGSGKTTLARKVYNHPNVKRHFDHFAWFCISQKWETRNILQGILVSFLPEIRREIVTWRDDEIIEQLLQIQQNSKCLVILDDIWSRDVWECIKVAFPVRQTGNKILLTTRKKDVAMHIGPNGYHHEPRLLSDSESWELLQKKAFRDRSNPGYGDIHELEALGKEMVKFCGGLPLAVVVLGGILASKHGYGEWNVVYKNIKSYLGKGESIEQDQGEVQKILALSYSDLPYKLKPCFLYLSMFSEDEDIEIERLFHAWTAEGMVFAEDRIGDESMMEVAERYLGELARRCIVTVEAVEMEIPSYKRFQTCRLHDLMRDLCIAKAKEEKFLKAIDYGHGNDTDDFPDSVSSSAGNFPRMVIYLSQKDSAKYDRILKEAGRHLRTLAFSPLRSGDFTAQLADSKFNRFKMLRSLTIDGINTPGVHKYMDKYYFPRDAFKVRIGNLIHLRCLRLRNSTLVLSPSSISNLEHLETLDMTESTIVFTRHVPIRARRLRHLYLPYASDIPLKIYVSNALEIIRGLGNPSIVVKNLSRLTNLREVQTWGIYAPKLFEDIIMGISNSEHIKQAFIDFIAIGNIMYPSERWSQLIGELLGSSVQNLRIHGLFCGFPEYDSRFLRNLLALRLESCSIQQDPMKMLEKLPNLERLMLWECTFPHENELMCRSGGFPKLRFLVFYHLGGLRHWRMEKGAMPSLSTLKIDRCFKLRKLPDALRLVTSLKDIVIAGMYVQFEERVLQDFGHVPSVVFR